MNVGRRRGDVLFAIASASLCSSRGRFGFGSCLFFACFNRPSQSFSFVVVSSSAVHCRSSFRRGGSGRTTSVAALWFILGR